jgi:hypothetical protein
MKIRSGTLQPRWKSVILSRQATSGFAGSSRRMKWALPDTLPPLVETRGVIHLWGLLDFLTVLCRKLLREVEILGSFVQEKMNKEIGAREGKRFWILDFGFWILDFGFWILDFG